MNKDALTKQISTFIELVIPKQFESLAETAAQTVVELIMLGRAAGYRSRWLGTYNAAIASGVFSPSIAFDIANQTHGHVKFKKVDDE